jgi:tyrosyl-tRNA synthetase
VLFGGDVADADAATFEVLAGEVPTVAVAPGRLAEGVDLLELLVEAGACSSKGEARRLAEQGGVSVNGRRAAAGDVVGADALLHGRFALLRRGKSGYHLLRVDAGGRSL